MKIVEFVYVTDTTEVVTLRDDESAAFGTMHFGASGDQPGIVIDKPKQKRTVFFPLARIAWVSYADE